MRRALLSAAIASFPAFVMAEETKDWPKVEITTVNFSQETGSDGFYTANVGVSGQECPGGLTINYSLTAAHVRNISDVRESIESKLSQLRDDLSKDTKSKCAHN
jgi:hypothetical protein